MIVTPLPASSAARVSCEAFSFRPWVPFPHLHCQNSASGPKELLQTVVLLCVRPVLNTYILHHLLLSRRALWRGSYQDESLPKVRAGQWQSKPMRSGIIPEFTDVELESQRSYSALLMSPQVSDPESDMLPYVMWPPMHEYKYFTTSSSFFSWKHHSLVQ